MQAIVQDGYGSADALQLRDVEQPVVGDDEVLVRVRAASVHPDVWHEYALVPAAGLAFKPANVTFEQAAAVPTAGYITLLNLPRARLRPGQRVLVNADLVRSLGADHAIDHTRNDFTRSGQRYDLIVDIPGNHPFAACRRALTPDGTYVLIGHDQFGRTGRRWLGSLPRFAKLAVLSLFVRHLRRAGSSGLSKKEAMARLRAHLEAGQLTPVIDRTYHLSQAGEAIRYLAEGEPVGRVVLTV